MKSKKVAIIGGGISGLYAAYRLAQKGYKVTLYEKDKVLGGELTAEVAGKLWPVERYYHHIFTHDEAILGLFDELGLGDTIRWYQSKVSVLRGRQVFPFDRASDLLALPFLSFIDKLRMGLGLLYLPRTDYKRREKITAHALVNKLMGENVWDKFWGPILRLKLGRYDKAVTASWFWGRVKDRSRTRKGQETLGFPDGGFSVLIDSLVKSLRKNKVRIVTGTEVSGIEKRDGNFNVQGEEYDIVIMAVSSPLALQITPGLLDKKETGIEHLAVLTILLSTKEKITDYYWTNILDDDLPFGVIVEQTNLVPRENYGKNLVYLGRYLDPKDPQYKMENDQLALSFIDKLDELYPGAKEKIICYRVFRDLYAQPVFTVGDRPINPETEVDGLYLLSSASIYPYDRGLDRVVALVDEVVKNI